MSIQDLGAIGEFVAAIAVVVSLVYLALQVRQATRIAKANAVQNIQRDVLELVTGDVKVIELNRSIGQKLKDGQPLTPVEDEYRRQRAVRALRIHENQWYQHRAGLLDDQLYQAYQGHWRVTAAIYPEWTERIKAHGAAMFHTEFMRDYLDLIDEKGVFLPGSEVDG